MKRPPYTERRGGQWWYRRRVPTRLVSVLGKSEYRESLHTPDIETAKVRAAVRNAEVQVELQTAQAQFKQQQVTSKSAAAPATLPPEALQYIRDAVHAHVMQEDEGVRKARPDWESLDAYADMTKAGSIAPPIKVGRVGNALYLVDGWHRMESGSYQTQELFADGKSGQGVLAQVATMSRDEIRWEAARANLGHGVALKSREFRGVFRAFIKAKRHHKSKGKLMSYREMSTALGVGVGHTTLRNWAMSDFPSLAKALGGIEHGNSDAEPPSVEGKSLEDEHREEAHKALQSLSQYAEAMGNPEDRWTLLQGLEGTAAKLRRLGVQEPAPTDF